MFDRGELNPNGHYPKPAKWPPNACHAGHQNPGRDLAIAFELDSRSVANFRPGHKFLAVIRISAGAGAERGDNRPAFR
jgi:hypothetical protein